MRPVLGTTVVLDTPCRTPTLQYLAFGTTPCGGTNNRTIQRSFDAFGRGLPRESKFGRALS